MIKFGECGLFVIFGVILLQLSYKKLHLSLHKGLAGQRMFALLNAFNNLIDKFYRKFDKS